MENIIIVITICILVVYIFNKLKMKAEKNLYRKSIETGYIFYKLKKGGSLK